VLTQVLEWVFPYDKSWRQPDDQFRNEIFCTLFITNLGHNLGRVLAYGLFGSLIVWWQRAEDRGGPALCPLPCSW